MRRTAAALALTTVSALTTLSACSDDADDAERTLTVFAAASLTSTFTELADDFEKEHPGVTVRLSFAGSADLLAQLTDGAHADVFAAADAATVDRLVDQALNADDPVDFASNNLMIAVPPGNPAKITDLADLARPSPRVVVCAPEVPCGTSALQVAQIAGVTLAPDSEEQSVTDVLAKVTSAEADAGIVYRTDVVAAGDAVVGIDFPESKRVVNIYPVVALDGSEQPALAREWIEFITGPGARVLTGAGFGHPLR